jgi:uncharacterized membrane protein
MTSKHRNQTKSNQSVYKNRNLLSGVLFGIGFAAFIDETIFHQLLHWHHFYDRSTTAVGLISDGLFHAFSWFATIAAFFILADLLRRDEWIAKRWWAGKLLGAGGFQLYDGTIQHKLMRIHQIRYVDNIIVYDWIWNILAVCMIIIGLILAKSQSRKTNI